MTFKKGEIPAGAKPFKKGESGNPAGRKPGSRSMKTILHDLLEKKLKNEPDPLEEGAARDMTAGEKVMLNWVVKAIVDGDLKAIKDIYEAMEGKPNQAVGVQSFNINTDVDSKDVGDALAAAPDDLIRVLQEAVLKFQRKV